MSMTTPVAVDGLPEDMVEGRGPNAAASAHWFKVAATLRDKPDQWFIVGEDASSSLPSRIKSVHINAFAEGTFEASGYKSKQITTTTNVYEKVYARYRGPRVPLAQPEPVKAEPKVIAPRPTNVPAAKVVPAPPQLTPMQKVAVSIARHHADARKIVWMDLPEDERARRVEAAGVAYQTVYGLIADDMENTVKAKVRRVVS